MVKLRDLLKTLMTPDPRDNISKTSSCDSRESPKRSSSFFSSFRSPAPSRSPTSHSGRSPTTHSGRSPTSRDSVRSLTFSRSSSAFSVLTSDEEELLGRSPTVPAVVSSLEGVVIAFPCFVRVLEKLSRAHVTDMLVQDNWTVSKFRKSLAGSLSDAVSFRIVRAEDGWAIRLGYEPVCKIEDCCYYDSGCWGVDVVIYNRKMRSSKMRPGQTGEEVVQWQQLAHRGANQLSKHEDRLAVRRCSTKSEKSVLSLKQIRSGLSDILNKTSHQQSNKIHHEFSEIEIQIKRSFDDCLISLNFLLNDNKIKDGLDEKELAALKANIRLVASYQDVSRNLNEFNKSLTVMIDLVTKLQNQGQQGSSENRQWSKEEYDIPSTTITQIKAHNQSDPFKNNDLPFSEEEEKSENPDTIPIHHHKQGSGATIVWHQKQGSDCTIINEMILGSDDFISEYEKVHENQLIEEAQESDVSDLDAHEVLTPKAENDMIANLVTFIRTNSKRIKQSFNKDETSTENPQQDPEANPDEPQESTEGGNESWTLVQSPDCSKRSLSSPFSVDKDSQDNTEREHVYNKTCRSRSFPQTSPSHHSTTHSAQRDYFPKDFTFNFREEATSSSRSEALIPVLNSISDDEGDARPEVFLGNFPSRPRTLYSREHGPYQSQTQSIEFTDSDRSYSPEPIKKFPSVSGRKSILPSVSSSSSSNLSPDEVKKMIAECLNLDSNIETEELEILITPIAEDPESLSTLLTGNIDPIKMVCEGMTENKVLTGRLILWTPDLKKKVKKVFFSFVDQDSMIPKNSVKLSCNDGNWMVCPNPITGKTSRKEIFLTIETDTEHSETVSTTATSPLWEEADDEGAGPCRFDTDEELYFSISEQMRLLDQDLDNTPNQDELPCGVIDYCANRDII